EIWYDKQELQSISLKKMNEYEIIDTTTYVVSEPIVEYLIRTPEKTKEINKECDAVKKDLDKLILEIGKGVFNSVEERAVTACSEKREDAWFIERLLIHHQKSLVYKLFHNSEFGKRLREQYTVLYYVSQILNGKENENNLKLRIPPELESTVEDVLKEIKAEQERYSK
ncbi:MAG: hypothetical protein FWD60_10350, partial [Candidatus Azobacteroides sp.]|nr:hypothetical protein [Candidatus Azobacteroides sp.]